MIHPFLQIRMIFPNLSTLVYYTNLTTLVAILPKNLNNKCKARHTRRSIVMNKFIKFDRRLSTIKLKYSVPSW